MNPKRERNALDRTNVPGFKHHRELNGGAPIGWGGFHPNVLPEPQCFEDIPRVKPVLNAIISTWYDGDIIQSTVKNCFEQGCSRVFILDNDSPDDSVEQALNAGAELAECYKTEFYDDDLRIKKQNDFIKRRVVSSAFDTKGMPSNIWWMALDADEFLIGHNGARVIDTLSTLSGAIRCVGSFAIDLYPQSKDEYIVGQHPAQCMSKGLIRRGGWGRYCECGHWKHSLLRYVDGMYDVALSRGNHMNAQPTGSTNLKEPPFGCWMFHAPLRTYDAAKARLTALCGKNPNGTKRRSAGDDEVTKDNGAIRRFKSLEHIYSGQWDRVDYPHSQMYGRPITGIALYPWRVLTPELAHLFIDPTAPVAIPPKPTRKQGEKGFPALPILLS